MNTRFCGSKFGASGIASVLSATIGTSGTPVCGNYQYDCTITDDILHFKKLKNQKNENSDFLYKLDCSEPWTVTHKTDDRNDEGNTNTANVGGSTATIPRGKHYNIYIYI